MKKRGQLTIFIIIGIVFLAIITLFFILNKDLIPLTNDADINNVFLFQENCMNQIDVQTIFKITSQEIITKVEINDEEILLEITYPISITKEESTTILSKPKKVEVPVRFGILYDTATDIVNNNLNKEICITCILDEVQSKNIAVDVIDYNNDTIIFVLTDEQSEITENNIELTSQ